MLKSSCHALRFQLGHTLRRRLAGLNVISECRVQYAHRTEFHSSRKLITATRADASILRFHGPNRPSDATKASQRVQLVAGRLAEPPAGGPWSRFTKESVVNQ